VWSARSFKFKLTLSYVLIIVISLGLVAFFLDQYLEEQSLADIKTSLINQSYLIESQISSEAIAKEDSAYLDTLVKRLGSKIKCRITIINLQGKVLADSEKTLSDTLKMENHATRPEMKLALGGSIGESIRHSATLKIDMLYVALPLQHNGQISGALRLSLPLASVHHMLMGIRKIVALSLLLTLALAFVLGSLLTRGIIQPLNKIINVSRKFSQGDFKHRVLHNSNDEIGELASTLNKMAQDIEDKIREVELRNQHLHTVFQNMVEGIIVLDKDGRVVSVNSAIEKIFNISKEETEGRFFLEAIRNDDISGIINDVLKKGEFISKELYLVYPVHKTFRINASAIFEKEGVNGCLLVIHDVTDIRNLEKMRQDFVANVSHELKTPLTSIKGFVETLLEGAIDDKENSRQFLKIIHEHANRLDSLVNDLLDLSYLESKEIRLEKEEINIRGLVEQILSGFKSQLKKKGVEAHNNLAGDLSIKADKGKIEQVLTNLIDNAVKFNQEHGSLDIYGEQLQDKIKITVEDSGTGIPPKDIPRIFERFYRVDKARSRKLGGTGLGLSIVKHIVELHGGTVSVESTEGLGSKFYFYLPR
jgi:two-component system phosphate regulon sensor histidine kinase PhoR